MRSQIAADAGNRRGKGAGGLEDPGTDEEVLSDPHCRHLVDYLAERGEPASVERLAEHVAARARGVPVESIGPNERRRVQTWLHHGQLPALEARGVVSYDADAGMVRLVGDDVGEA